MLLVSLTRALWPRPRFGSSMQGSAACSVVVIVVLSLCFFWGLSGEAASASDRISSSAPEIAWLSMCHEFDDAFFFFVYFT